MAEEDLLDALLKPEHDYTWKLAMGQALHQVREDLREVSTQTTMTNGRVNAHDRFIAMLMGGMVVIGAALVPLFIFAVEHAVVTK
jgi:hypothetical protein